MSYTIRVDHADLIEIIDNVSFDLVDCYDVDEYRNADECFYADDIGEWFATDYDLSYCDNCGRWIYDQDNWNYDQDCCTDCEIESIIGDYHSAKGDWYTYTTNGDKKLIGFEWEIDNGRNAEECAHAVRDILGEHVYFEHDGSLHERGFEIISHPHDWESFKQLPLAEACAEIKRHGYTSHDNGRCGLHLHFSREWFGDTTEEQNTNIALVVKFYRENWDKLVALSRRNDFYFCKPERDYTGRSLNQIIESKKDSDRYTAVNLNNLDRYGTIEFRLGRGTLKYETFVAWVDIHRAIAEASKTAQTLDFEEWINAETVNAETMDYINMRLELLKKREELVALESELASSNSDVA